MIVTAGRPEVTEGECRQVLQSTSFESKRVGASTYSGF